MDGDRLLSHRHCFKCGRVAVFIWLENIQVEAKDILCGKCSKETRIATKGNVVKVKEGHPLAGLTGVVQWTASGIQGARVGIAVAGHQFQEVFRPEELEVIAGYGHI